jgi:serine/threonine protein kinase
MFSLSEGMTILTPGCRSASANLYVAQALEADTHVMIKETKLTQHSQDDSLANEILFMRELTHPNVTKILNAFLLDASVIWIVMDYMDGATLARVIAEHNTLEEKYIACISREVSLARAIVSYHLNFSSFWQICKGLEYLHARGIVHRDIKSDNIFLGIHGEVRIGTRTTLIS